MKAEVGKTGGRQQSLNRAGWSRETSRGREPKRGGVSKREGKRG